MTVVEFVQPPGPEHRYALAVWRETRPAACPCGHPWDQHAPVDLCVRRGGRVDAESVEWHRAEGWTRWMVTCDGTPPTATDDDPWSHVCAECVGPWHGAPS